MQITIYADILFFVNFGMDFFILWLTRILAKQQSPLWRLFLGSFFLSFFYCLPLFIGELAFLYRIYGALPLFGLGIWLGLMPANLREWVKLFVLGCLSSFAVGGLGMALFYLTGFSLLGGGLFGEVRHFPWKVLVVTSSIVYLGVKFGQRWITAHITDQRNHCTAVIRHGKQRLTLRVLIDTGNGLRDPFSGNAVLIAAFPAIEDFFSQELRLLFFEHKISEQELQEEALQRETSLRLRLIPFSSLGESNGLLLAFDPEEVSILWGDTALVRTDVTIGVYQGVFDGGYEGLVHPELLRASA